MTGIQYSLFRDQCPHQQAFDHWRKTKGGGHIVNLFIREAVRAKRNGEWATAKGICEDLRRRIGSIRARMEVRGIHLQESDGFALNNNFTAYLARFSMERCPELNGYFRLRDLGATKAGPKRVYVVEPVNHRPQMAMA